MKLSIRIIFKISLILTFLVGCASTQKQSLQEQCFDPNYKLGGDSRTRLMLVAEIGHTESVKHMLALDDDVNAKNNDGDTALTWAKKRGHEEIVHMLKEAGAKG